MRNLSLSGNWLKIIAAICMVIDHIGVILFPYNMTFRIIGRLAFPIFAFLIAEGCRYTRNRLRYFMTMATFAVVFQAVYAIFSEPIYLNIFFTLALSILIIYSIDAFYLAARGKDMLRIFLSAFIAILTIASVYIICRYFPVDYGFWGCMLPAFAYTAPCKRELCRRLLRLSSFAVGMYPIIGSVEISVQPYSYFALIPLLLYNGKRGKYNMKYFFYIFYPLHLAVLYAIQLYMT